MTALAAASERRSEHEIAAHNYRHKRLEEPVRSPHGALRSGKGVPRPDDGKRGL